MEFHLVHKEESRFLDEHGDGRPAIISVFQKIPYYDRDYKGDYILKNKYKDTGKLYSMVKKIGSTTNLIHFFRNGNIRSRVSSNNRFRFFRDAWGDHKKITFCSRNNLNGDIIIEEG